MKILLVLPADKTVRVTREQSHVPKRKMLRFSVQPLTIVAALSPPEHDVQVVDENVEPLDFDTDADWLYAQFYRLDRILWRFMRNLLALGWLPALLGLKLGLTYRYDNKRENIVGWNPEETSIPIVRLCYFLFLQFFMLLPGSSGAVKTDGFDGQYPNRRA
jgi:hypothetical protein